MRKMSEIVRNQDPLTLPPNATVGEACQCMRDRRVGAVLVTEADGRLVGIFTGRDAVHRVLAEGKGADNTKLDEVMTRDPDAMPPGKTAIEVLRLTAYPSASGDAKCCSGRGKFALEQITNITALSGRDDRLPAFPA